MYAWLVARVGRLVAWLIIVVVLLLVLGGIYKAVQHYFVGDLATQVEVEKGRTGAAIESGHQSVEIVGNRQAAEQNGAATVQESQREINNATDPGGVTDAGLSGLHRVRSRSPGNQRR